LYRRSFSQCFTEYIVDVTIKLRDVNDEPPVFTMEPYPYLAVFNANLPPNSKVDYVISVRDPDANSKLVYSLLEGQCMLYSHVS